MPHSEQGSLVHCVFFTLKDRSATAARALVEACHKYLDKHPGVVHFSAGPRAAKYQRPVNDAEFDVALVLVFASEKDHDEYQTSDRHKQFLAEQQPTWSAVRVFDALA